MSSQYFPTISDFKIIDNSIGSTFSLFILDVVILVSSWLVDWRFMDTDDGIPSNKASSKDFFGFFCCGTVILLFVNVYGLVVPEKVSFAFDLEDLFSFVS